MLSFTRQVLVGFALLTFTGVVSPVFAADEAPASGAAKAAPAVAPLLSTAPPAAQPVAEPVKAAEAPAKPTEVAKPAEEKKAEPAKAPEGEKKKGPHARLVISERVSVGNLGKNLACEYGVQAELTSKHLGVTLFWADYQTYPDKVGFTQNFGFAFHYYPFGKGPSGMYVGPGFNMIHFKKQGDPVTKGMLDYQAKISGGDKFSRAWREWGVVTRNRTGYGKDFDLLGPMVRIGYRYQIWYVTFAAEATLGYMFSDQPARWGSKVMFAFSPQVGVTW